MKLNLLAIAAVPALLSAASFGATITSGTLVFNNGGSGYASGSSDSFSYQQFDPSLGTLLGVKIEITGNSHDGLTAFENTSAFAGSATVSIGTTIQVTGPGSLVVITTPNQSASGAVSAFDGTQDFAGLSSISVVGTNSSDTKSASLSYIFDDLSSYIGTGNVTYNFTSSVYTLATGNVSPNLSTSEPTKYDFTAIVTYTYAPVPEAASLGILSVSSLALLARRRK